MTRANAVKQRVILLATNSSQSIIGESVEGTINTIGYSAYGEQSAQQEVASALGFNGQLREAKLGWYLLGNGYRAYNTRLMRFHSPDSWSPFGPGGLNAYMYCVGDPVNRVDPTGHMTLLKFLSKSFDFFFGGADVTGPRRLTSAQASTIERLGGLRPEKTGEGNGLANVAKAVIAGAPVKKPSGLYPGGDIAPQGVKGWERPVTGQGTSWRVSPSAQQSHSPRAHRGGASLSARPNRPAAPPTYEEATYGMDLWNKDTFAASQRGKIFVVASGAPHVNYPVIDFAHPIQSIRQPPALPPPPLIVVVPPPN